MLGDGVLLSLVVTGANRHEVSRLATLLDTVIIECPDIRHLCLEKGYTGEPALEVSDP
ncbi:MAG: hypothetical protein LBK62_06820 [Treponema sp.]|nr:hypothetical protein [Treponema sp.]